MPGALTHTRITWFLSPMAPQVPGVTPGSPLRPCVGGTPYGECATCILVVGDVLEHCLVVGCVLGVMRLEVCLVAGLLP
jgi:hypothetical protein